MLGHTVKWIEKMGSVDAHARAFVGASSPFALVRLDHALAQEAPQRINDSFTLCVLDTGPLAFNELLQVLHSLHIVGGKIQLPPHGFGRGL
ncbi:hypothetical protein [Hymenobacter jejuensis]|uniref:Uncharacterized protein n=1 Tax=Hymenobacter jejuensis TaxID=2502781 RepID=A0A5B7ZWG4_9BACT|nr:hypothetical protein [Hymenobacter jejuensis]QDA59481.1 hypothetical protein FHG12_04885 [Hymenobacter jejuensis]